jgi:hypothetical protein
MPDEPLYPQERRDFSIKTSMSVDTLVHLPRNSLTSLMVACGFSSMIQWPELGTMPTVTKDFSHASMIAAAA